jgi:hypothetical protein
MESYIAPGTCGTLLLYRGKLPMEVPAEVSYVSDAEIAFVYRFDSSEEQDNLDTYLGL